MKRHWIELLHFIVVLIFLAGCTPAARQTPLPIQAPMDPVVTPRNATPLPTATLQPTRTLTRTPTPTLTPLPTQKVVPLTPVATPVNPVLTDGKNTWRLISFSTGDVFKTQGPNVQVRVARQGEVFLTVVLECVSKTNPLEMAMNKGSLASVAYLTDDRDKRYPLVNLSTSGSFEACDQASFVFSGVPESYYGALYLHFLKATPMPFVRWGIANTPFQPGAVQNEGIAAAVSPNLFTCKEPILEDFSKSGTFEEIDTPVVQGGFLNGAYRVMMKQAGMMKIVFDNIAVDDALIKVSATSNGEGDGSYGLVFGRMDTGPLYAFVVHQNGFWALFHLNDQNNWETIQDYTLSSAVHPGKATNQLMVARSQEMIGLWVNGVAVANGIRAADLKGALKGGFILFSYDSPGIAVDFDNYSICPLEEPFPVPLNPAVEQSLAWSHGAPVLLTYSWLAGNRQLAQVFAQKASIVVLVDDQLVADTHVGWGKVEMQGKDALINWQMVLKALPPGIHHITFSLTTAQQVTDGFDSNKNGKLDQFGPLVVPVARVELVVK